LELVIIPRAIFHNPMTGSTVFSMNIEQLYYYFSQDAMENIGKNKKGKQKNEKIRLEICDLLIEYLSRTRVI